MALLYLAVAVVWFVLNLVYWAEVVTLQVRCAHRRFRNSCCSELHHFCHRDVYGRNSDLVFRLSVSTHANAVTHELTIHNTRSNFNQTGIRHVGVVVFGILLRQAPFLDRSYQALSLLQCVASRGVSHAGRCGVPRFRRCAAVAGQKSDQNRRCWPRLFRVRLALRARHTIWPNKLGAALDSQPITHNCTHTEQVGYWRVILALPVALLDGGISWWVLFALWNLQTQLRLKKQELKLALYRRFTTVLVVSILAAVVFAIYQTCTVDSCMD